MRLGSSMYADKLGAKHRTIHLAHVLVERGIDVGGFKLRREPLDHGAEAWSAQASAGSMQGP